MSADHHEGLSPAGPAEDEMGGQPNATPPFTDGHTASGEPGSQVLLVCCKHCQHTVHDKLNHATITLGKSQSAASCAMAELLVAH